MPVEAISLSVGVIALASLFSTCVECFDLLDAGQGFGRDYELLIIQLQLEKTRLLDFGQSVGLLETEGVQRPVDLDSRILRPVVEHALNAIHQLWTDSDQLTSRYGLEESKSDGLDFIMEPKVGLSANAWYRQSWERFQAKTYANRRQTPLTKKVRWALHDRAKFKTLVDDLRNLVDALLAVTRSRDTTEQRHQLMRGEIRSIQDATVLSLLAENTSEIDRDWSEAASEALETSHLDEEERVSVCDWLDRVAWDKEPISLLTDQAHGTIMGLLQEAHHDQDLSATRNELYASLRAIIKRSASTAGEKDLGTLRTQLSDIRRETAKSLQLLKALRLLKACHAFLPAIEQDPHVLAFKSTLRDLDQCISLRSQRLTI